MCVFSDELKQAASVKSQSLVALQEENNKLTRELGSSKKETSGQQKVPALDYWCVTSSLKLPLDFKNVTFTLNYYNFPTKQFIL